MVTLNVHARLCVRTDAALAAKLQPSAPKPAIVTDQIARIEMR